MQTGKRVVIFETARDLEEALELVDLERALVDQLRAVIKKLDELRARMTMREVAEGGLRKAG